MKPSITDLHCLSDKTLFEAISEGVAHIVENAESLESMAVHLIKIGEHRGARMVRALAAEESAKVLILIDVVRCPLEESDKRATTLRRFYNHLAKHIHAKACSWVPADFAELERAIHRERRALYLDGPNEVDWIFPNYATTERARPMYVDYVKDITDVKGDCQWISPITHREYRENESLAPMSLITARALHGIGLTTPEGLSIVADEWRPFKPVPHTRYFSDLSPRIKQTLLRVIQRGLCSETDSHYRTVIDHWPFPLWSLDLTPLKTTIDELRNERQEYIEELRILEAQRDPPPQIGRNKIEKLSRTYDDWMRERDQRRHGHAERKRDGEVVVYTSPLLGELNSLESYKKLDHMVRELTLEEQMDLAALAWFGRNPQSGWEYCYSNARKVISEGSTNYICELGGYWLKGLERWESDPELPASLTPGNKKV